jgi:hypothetical protein
MPPIDVKDCVAIRNMIEDCFEPKRKMKSNEAKYPTKLHILPYFFCEMTGMPVSKTAE